MLVGGIGLLVGSFLPTILRVVHGLEILADSLCYTVVLSFLFCAREKVIGKQPLGEVVNPGAVR
jgi:hypothetical protein